MKKFLFIIELILISCLIFAKPIDIIPFKVVQPNGDSITIVQYGDEYGIWYETKNGDIIDIEPNTQNFYYVKPSISNVIVGNNSVSPFNKNLMMTII